MGSLQLFQKVHWTLRTKICRIREREAIFRKNWGQRNDSLANDHYQQYKVADDRKSYSRYARDGGWTRIDKAKWRVDTRTFRWINRSRQQNNGQATWRHLVSSWRLIWNNDWRKSTCKMVKWKVRWLWILGIESRFSTGIHVCLSKWTRSYLWS